MLKKPFSLIKGLNTIQIRVKKHHNRRNWIIVLVVLILVFFLYDSLRLSTILVKKKEKVAEERPTLPSVIDVIEEKEVDEAAVPVCEYKDLVQKNISPPDKNDDIQENIGYQNNKVGLYIYAEVEEFTEVAAKLANSNGGDWGYVLIPYNVKDYNETRWGKLFQNLSEAHLIPIIQLWDIDLEKDKREEQMKDSAKFLNSLPWPIQPRYISVYNEPNDAKFWKGDVNPEEYAEILEETIDTFNELNEDFFIMNGAFNSSARTGGDYLDEEAFMIRMNSKVPGIFKKLDGWASHPYPQPNFAGSPNASGRDSIRAYEWELSILKRRFGIDTDKFPVFITETGWAHRESEAADNGEPVDYRLNQYQVADNYKSAFENVWLKDDRIVAVTPFTVRYDHPHDHFSWVTKTGTTYPQFNAVKDLKKVKGKPPVISYVKSRVIICD
jgi:hypothetical protein